MWKNEAKIINSKKNLRKRQTGRKNVPNAVIVSKREENILHSW